VLGKIEEYSSSQLAPGDTFLFAGKVLRFEGIASSASAFAPRAGPRPEDPGLCRRQVPALDLSRRAGARDAGRSRRWGGLPEQVRDWLACSGPLGAAEGASQMLVETFPRADKHYMVCYPFEGRLAHQTLGMLLTRRLERAGLRRWASSPPNMRWRLGAAATSAS
jgi:ATP-dependent Lhr-like helicase